MPVHELDVPAIPGLEVRGFIKEGGMGRVYKAWNPRLQRLEALKFIAPHLITSPEIRERFDREAVSVASLIHPNIAILYGAGEAGGYPYLSFEYLGGGTLAGRIRHGTLRRQDIFRFALDLASGLQYAHRHGVIHLDVKPSNALFDFEDRLKLIDFGLAKLRSDALRSSSPDAIGSPHYMSPEQAMGAPLDHRSDIYSFGVVLYEMAVRRRPFESHSFHELCREIVEDQPPLLSDSRPELGAGFITLVDQMLSKEPGRRPSSMDEVVDRLKECAERTATSRAPRVRIEPGPVQELETLTTRPPFRRRLILAIVFTVLIALAALMGPGLRGFLLQSSAGTPPAPPVVVILPFQSAGRQPELIEFASALDARLAGELVQAGRTREIFSIPPVSDVRSYNIRNVAEARKKLNAGYVFGGTVVLAGTGYEILLSLSNAATGAQIKAGKVRVEHNALDRLDSVLRDAALGMLPEQVGASSAIIASAQTFSSPVAYELCMRAQGLLRRYTGPGPVDTALELLDQAARLDPKSAEVHAWMAEARIQKWQHTGDPSFLNKAESSSARASALGSKLRAVRLAAGRVAQARGKWDNAVAEFTAAIQVDPGDLEAYRFLGRVYLNSGRAKEAEATLRKAVEMNPHYWPTRTSLGTFYFQQNRPREALAEFQYAAELFPDNPLVHANLGGAYYKLDRIDEAAAAFETSLKKEPTGLAYSNLGSVRYYQSRFLESAQLFEYAVAERPNDAPAWCYLGEAYARLPGREKNSRDAFLKAAGLFETLLKANPRRADTWSRMAITRAYLGDRRAARRAISEASKLAPDDATVLYRLARAEARLQDRNDAVVFLAKALEKGYPHNEVLREPGLEQVRNDPRLRALLQ